MRSSIPLQSTKKKWKIISWKSFIAILIILALTMSIVFAWGYFQLQKPLPQIEGSIQLEGLQKNVSVWRDENGVPHIIAENEHDLFMAQGYVTAQDRLFQMDLSRRQASGQLAEVIGEKVVDRDKFFRTIGLRRAAEASLELYSNEAKLALEAYEQGVNVFIKEVKAKGTLPIEFRILGYEPTEWSSVDSLTIGKYMAYDLAGHWEGQAFRYHLTQHYSDDKVLDLFPTYPEDAPTILQAIREHPINISTSFAKAMIPNEFNGSNNWVVSGNKTETGFPLLADDPHLSLATPGIWYETHLQSPSVNVSGVIFAGIPGVILGHNEDIAWGVTNVGPDVQDLYIEKRNPENDLEFEYMGEWEKATVIQETITVKDKEDIPYEVVITRHGPVFSDFALTEKSDTVLSLRWTAHDPSPELEAVLKMNKAKDWEEFKEALKDFHTPAQNFVFASKDGTIAYRANGKIPIRKNGDSLLPVPGWTDEYEWEDYIPWEELPTIVNPESGYISTANNKVVDDDYPYHISNVWAQPYRQMRIKEFLESKQKLSVEDMKALQFDQKNLHALEMIPLLGSGLNTDEMRSIDKKALNLLTSWDGTDRKEEAAPLIFHLWMNEIAEVLFEEEFDESIMKLFEGRAQIVDELIRKAAAGNPGPWIEEKGGLTSVATVALSRTIDTIVELQGDNPDKWNWGEFHAIPFPHPLGAVKPLDLLFNHKPVPVGGSRVTVMAAGWSVSTGLVNHGAGWRGVMDLSNLDEAHYVVGPGQSGHVTSQWYDDQIDDWVNGEYHITSMEKDIFAKSSKKLTLTPQK